MAQSTGKVRDRAPSHDRPARGRRDLLRNRNWATLWLGQAVSLTGDSVFRTTSMLWVATVLAKGRPWAPIAAGGVLIAAAVPIMVIGPVAGVFVDRWDRRRTMMTADASRTILICLLLAMSVLGRSLSPVTQIAMVYAIIAGASAAAQFFNPSRLATLGRVVDPADRPRATATLQATGSLAVIVGPPAGAFLLFAFGASWGFMIDAASFAVSFLTIRALRLPEPADPTPADRAGFLAEFRAGIRFFSANRVLIALSTGVIVATLGTGALNALLVFFVTRNLHTPAKSFGILEAAIGVGAIAGALLAGLIAERVGPARLFELGMICGGLFLLIFSRMTSFPMAVALGALIGLAFAGLNVAAPQLFLASIPQELIGRVMSILNPLQQVANISSVAASGFLASTVLAGLRAQIAGVAFGPIDTIFGGCALFVLLGGLSVTMLLGRGA